MDNKASLKYLHPSKTREIPPKIWWFRIFFVSLPRKNNINKEIKDMTTAILNNGSCYSIPEYDVEFFRAIAKKMGWIATPITDKTDSKRLWVDQFAGKWQDSRSTEEIIEDIHKARTPNDEIVL